MNMPTQRLSTEQSNYNSLSSLSSFSLFVLRVCVLTDWILIPLRLFGNGFFDCLGILFNAIIGTMLLREDKILKPFAEKIGNIFGGVHFFF